MKLYIDQTDAMYEPIKRLIDDPNSFPGIAQTMFTRKGLNSYSIIVSLMKYGFIDDNGVGTKPTARNPEIMADGTIILSDKPLEKRLE
jgi:hypothetical protein